MWKRIGVLGAMMLCLWGFVPQEAEAQPGGGGPFGLGIILGDPTGITGKYWVAGNQAIDFHLGVDGFGGRGFNNDLGLYADYLFHFPLTNISAFRLDFYVGPGLALILDFDDRYCTKFRCYDRDSGIGLAIRAPIGLAMLFNSFSGELFLELPLNVWLVPFQDFDLDVALGFRYYF